MTFFWEGPGRIQTDGIEIFEIPGKSTDFGDLGALKQLPGVRDN